MFYLFTFYFILFLLLLLYDYFSMSVLVYKWYRSKSMFSLFSSIAIPPAVLPWNRVTWTYFWYISWSPTSLQPLNHLTLRIYSTVSSLSWLKKYAIWFALKGIHISWNNAGANLRSWILLLRQNGKISFPRKNWKLPQNTNMFFQAMSDLLLHTYYGIVGAFMIWNYGI